MNNKSLYKCIAAFSLVIGSLFCNAQSTAGITNKPDTSYTTYGAYINTKKSHPEISIAEELHSKSITEKKGQVYCQVGNRTLLVDVFYPSKTSAKPRAAIMIIFGGGWRSGNRTQHYPLAQQLANRGYVCFTPDYRLSTEALYPAAVYDLKAALRWIHANAKKYGVDTMKIAVAGFSAGGELAAFIGTTKGDKKYEGIEGNNSFSSNVQAIIDIDGTLSFVNAESGEGDDSKRTSAATYWFGYSKKEAPALWAEASPLAHVSKATPPTLFINSSVERMHAGREDYLKILKENGTYADVKSFPDAPHSFPFFHPWFNPMVNYIDEFLLHLFSKPKEK